MSLEAQKSRLNQKIATLPEGEAKERARLHLAEVEQAMKTGKSNPPTPLPSTPLEKNR